MKEDRPLTFFQESHVDHVSDLFSTWETYHLVNKYFREILNIGLCPSSSKNQVERVTYRVLTIRVKNSIGVFKA